MNANADLPSPAPAGGGHRAAPYAHDRSSVERIMLQVCLALTPATLYGLYLFGLPAILTFLCIVLAAIATEALCLWLQGQSLWRLKDASALLTGWLLAMSMPPWCPWWLSASGAFFAIAIGKHLYGGIGQNVFNPAMLARVALLISFPVQMTTWVQVMPLGSDIAPGLSQSLAIFFGEQGIPDGFTGATLLGASKAAAKAMTEQVALQNAPHGIRVNCIQPGLMNTPMAVDARMDAWNMTREEVVAMRDAKVPLGGKMGTAWDVANAALFLVSDEARFITGVTLMVDGGAHCRIG